jgi:hypothetical protein
MIEFLRTLFVALAILAITPVVEAHSLGVDRANLIERPGHEYLLISKVPPSLALDIVTPRIPDNCAFDENPMGLRGEYTVTFQFSCASSLTASDQILLPWNRDGVLLTATWLDGSQETQLVQRNGRYITLELQEFRAGSGGWSRAAQRYFKLGFTHILEGFDHLIFVLVLLFFVDGFRAIVKTITAFTLAHSITLGFSTVGLISLPSVPVETLIAFSILLMAAEVVRHHSGQDSLTYRSPWVVAFVFGLLHGLGFAGALSEVGLSQSEVPVALLFFNLGVEAGQLVFVGAVLTLWIGISRLQPLRNGLRLLRATVIVAIGTISGYWVVDRLWGLFELT